MAVTQADLDDFHQFASERIGRSHAAVTFDDLVIEWESLRDRDDINIAIREGVADVKTGRYRPAEDAIEDLRQKHGLTAE